MTPLDKLKQKVAELYISNNPDSDPWNFWGYPKHVLVVAKSKIEDFNESRKQVCSPLASQ